MLPVLGLLAAGCGHVNLIATETPALTPPPLSAAVPRAIGARFEAPRCVEYDDYQGASMAFYSLSAIVQSGLDEATSDAAGESLDAAVARFDRAVRRALAGEPLVDPDPIEELALLWVASDGCMR